MARVDGGPEALLRIDERRRLLDQPPLGPMLLTPDAQNAGLPVSGVIVTDTPLARETDYGRVDDHSSAIRTADDTRRTYNRVPDYPAPGADTVYGAWTGGRLTVSSSAADSTALPNVVPATGPAAAIDGDSSTSWVSNALQSAVGQWLQVDFDRPVTNATITITPSATAVGAQIRRIQVSTVNGTSTLRFDEAGKPLTAALPYGETPWVRITAVGTDDGSPGVQFGITDFTVTQYDASGFAHPVALRHTVLVPGPPPDSVVAQWDLGSELLGRSGCAAGPDGVRCAAAMALSPEEPVNLSRTLTVPDPIDVSPTVWVRARQGPNLADLIRQPGTTRAGGDADPIDVLGSSYAATDGDPGTAWTAPQRVVQHKSPPTLTLTLPTRSEVAALRVTPSSSELPAHPTMVAVDLGDGPQVRRLETDGVSQTLALRPRVTDTVTLSILDWDDVIDRTALGFDQLKPPGLAEVAVLDVRGEPIAAADAGRNRERAISLPCGRGPVIAVAGQFVQTAVDTTVGTLLDGGPIAARVCRAEPITLPTGQQELLISPGAAFFVDGVQLNGPRASQLRTAATVPVDVGNWAADHREVDVPASPVSRLLVVPESINPGWTARSTDGGRLHPVTVNGWQQGLGDPGRDSRSRDTDVRVQHVLPCGLGWRACRAAATRAARAAAGAPTACTRRSRAALAARPGGGECRSAGGRGGNLRRGRRGRGRGGPRRTLSIASAAGVTRRTDGRHRGGRADPGRGGVIAEPVAVGGRLRGTFGGSPVVGADLGRRVGGVGRRGAAQRLSVVLRRNAIAGTDRLLASAGCRSSTPPGVRSIPPISASP